MIDIEPWVSLLSGSELEGNEFHPQDVQLTDYFPSTKSADEGESGEVVVEEDKDINFHEIKPSFPKDKTIVAIDSTGFQLGQIRDGLVVAVRASVIVKPRGLNQQQLELYGPYLSAVTNRTKDQVYTALYGKVFNKELESSAPNLTKMIDRIRTLLEKYIQMQVVANYSGAVVLLDGSLIARTIDSPLSYMEKLIGTAYGHGNNIVAISKSTTLTLRTSKRNILSLVEGLVGPVHTDNIRPMISQERDRYKGHIYVSRLTALGEPFRIDIPDDTPVPHSELLSFVSGLAGDYGYPEELKLAHSTCVLSSLEILELQAAAMALYGLEMQEDLRKKIFPFG